MVTVCLAMIVRDEADNLPRNLEAAARLADRAVLVDTGSTDATIDVARAWCADHDLPLELHEEPWENFKVNRSSLMRHAGASGADWLLLLDADLVVHAPDPLPDLDACDVWQGRVDFGTLDYTLPFLVRASKPWRYEGVAHSYLACGPADAPEPYTEGELEGLWVEDYSHTGPAKLERDLAALSAEHARNPLDRRTVFYLAQTYFDLDRLPEATVYYRMRAEMGGGWDEETYFARYRLGCLLVEHVSFADGARELLRAWEARPGRAEALRALAGAATSVANKLPRTTDRLFVGTPAYQPHDLPRPTPVPAPAPVAVPAFPSVAPDRNVRLPGRAWRPSVEEVTAIIPTRGNVPLGPCMETLPYPEIIVWDNSRPTGDVGVVESPRGGVVRIVGGTDYKAFGRYAAIPLATRPLVYWQDDDVVFTEHEALLAAYRPGQLVCNMDDPWIDGAGYRGTCGMQGAGSIVDADLPARVWAWYLAHHPWDEEALVEADFVFGTLAPFTVVDLGYRAREFADGPDRLYTQPGQTERKHSMIRRCLDLRASGLPADLEPPRRPAAPTRA